MNTPVITSRLPQDLVEKINELATVRGVTRSEIMREALSGYVEAADIEGGRASA